LGTGTAARQERMMYEDLDVIGNVTMIQDKQAGGFMRSRCFENRRFTHGGSEANWLGVER
jgi:hypothetical protein